ncbi:hypothetical protein ACFQMA_06135 [Halosimplex aquaticum]|uniref:Uncharacterized protein n=1 Tax=Halosimplex aquaticum TaxID=3026162 RepID=A0ABD5XZK7_9EURY|nr:hypothetical protein [Halosimplex aquaticum]
MSRRGFELGTRGRVPFALVGVLLVLSSALFASAVDRPQPTPEPAVDLAVERTTADARAAVRTAVADAGVAAASDPVLTPANNEWGDVLDPETAFEDALRARIYLAARERLGSVARTHRGVTANASLAPTPTPEALGEAIERVEVERTGPKGTSLRVEISNVTVQATDDGRVVGTERVSFTVVVATPVLAVHDRVEAYQERLKAGVAEPGLGQRLTARLYAVAWARGYAQYGGAPIDNVVANRHVELMANGAILGVQRSTFGRSDPDGRQALLGAMAAVGIQDLVSARGPADPGVNKLLQQQLRSATAPAESAGVPGLASGGTDAPAPNETIDVSVGLSADRAFRELLREEAINGTIDSVYGARVRTVAATERVSGGKPDRPGPPDDPNSWEFRAETTDTDVIDVSNATRGPSVTVPSGYHRLDTYVRWVRLRHERRAVWYHNGSVNATTRTSTETERVTVAVVGDHAVTRHAPDNPIATVHERGGPFDGPNLADVPGKVREEVLDAGGGRDALAGRAARGALDTSPRSIDGEWPGEVSPWIYGGLVDLRRTVRNASVSVSRGKMGTHEVNPGAKLAAHLRDRRAALVGAPSTYPHVAAKARAAVRGRYLDLVIARLEDRADERSKREAALADALESVGGPSLSQLRSGYDARRAADRGSSSGSGGRVGESGTDPVTGLDMHVDGAPPYLTLTEVKTGDVTAVRDEDSPTYPLTARNVNYVTIPYGDATDAVLTALMPGGSSRERRLVTAARALRAANETLDHRPNATVEERRDRLRVKLDSTVDAIRDALGRKLRRLRVGNGSAQRDRIVDDGLSQWDTLDGRALALSNGSVIDPIVAAAEERTTDDGWTTRERDRVRLRLRTALYDSLESERGKVSGPAVTGATEHVKAAVRKRVKSEVSGVLERQFNESVNQIPAGIPLAPPLGNWVATMNVWSVTVRGQYARFAVETPRRTPGAGDASLNYVRDGSNATLDIDEDGEADVLGRASRVTFTTRTSVVVVVPAGGTGVGDIDGKAIEESKGWAIPGPVDRERPWTGEKYPLSINGSGDTCDRSDGPDAPVDPRPAGVETDPECRAESDSDL